LEVELTSAALALVKKASKDFHPVSNLATMDVRMFISFLHTRKPGRKSKSKRKGQKYLSRSGYGNYRSALNELFRECGVEKAPDFLSGLNRMFKGLQRKSAAQRQKDGEKLGEGKDPMSFKLYSQLCHWMMEDGGSEGVFGHAFLTWTWNLICRSKNTTHIHRNHISWSDDAMVVMFAHMKNDMEGFESQVKRHVYSNPNMPHLCAVLATAKYLATIPPSTEGAEQGMLFPKASYERFRKYLELTVRKHAEDLNRMSIDAEDIGVHSIRKGAATYCCSGTTMAPSIAAVCNRAGWSMGQVKDIYIRYEAASDHYVGRIVAGLDVPVLTCYLKRSL
jgi:hypothetical protein